MKTGRKKRKKAGGGRDQSWVVVVRDRDSDRKATPPFLYSLIMYVKRNNKK